MVLDISFFTKVANWNITISKNLKIRNKPADHYYHVLIATKEKI